MNERVLSPLSYNLIIIGILGQRVRVQAHTRRSIELNGPRFKRFVSDNDLRLQLKLWRDCVLIRCNFDLIYVRNCVGDAAKFNHTMQHHFGRYELVIVSSSSVTSSYRHYVH